ncbi:MAG: MFS transporter [Planctomycetes bacterium]|nr:MFS transporter [Planctomycetota bacterium]
MALSEKRWQRLGTLCALYFAQGVPWGFMATALVSYLTSRGVSDAQAGDLTAIVLVPWTFKLVWGPLIDSLTIRSMGRRRAWIIGAELMMAFTLLGMVAMGDLTQELKLLGWMFFLHNCFASLQDVSTDALAVDILPFSEQGPANGLMWGSKLLGKGLGAAVMAWVMDRWGLPTAVWVQFFLLVSVMLFPLCFLERPGERRFPWSRGRAMPALGAPDGDVRNPALVLKDLGKGFSLTATAAFAVFGTVKLVGSGVNEIVNKTLYTQKLGWGYVEYSGVLGLYSIPPVLLAALAGGYMANRFGRRNVIVVGFGGYALVAVAFAVCPGLWHERWFTTSYLLATEGLLAMGSVGFLSMAMRLSWTTSAATMFTTYMTLSNVGHVVGNKLAGPVRQWLTFDVGDSLVGVLTFVPLSEPAAATLAYQPVFWFVALASLCPLFLLPLVEPARVDDARAPALAPSPV